MNGAFEGNLHFRSFYKAVLYTQRTYNWTRLDYWSTLLRHCDMLEYTAFTFYLLYYRSNCKNEEPENQCEKHTDVIGLQSPLPANSAALGADDIRGPLPILC